MMKFYLTNLLHNGPINAFHLSLLNTLTYPKITYSMVFSNGPKT